MEIVKPNGDIIRLTVDEYKQLYGTQCEPKEKINSIQPITKIPYSAPTIEQPWKTTFTC